MILNGLNLEIWVDPRPPLRSDASDGVHCGTVPSTNRGIEPSRIVPTGTPAIEIVRTGSWAIEQCVSNAWIYARVDSAWHVLNSGTWVPINFELCEPSKLVRTNFLPDGWRLRTWLRTLAPR